MPRSSTFQLTDGAAKVRELSVGELRDWWREEETRDAPPADFAFNHLLGNGLRLDELQRMVELSGVEWDALGGEDLDKLEDAARELNPRFFGMKAEAQRMAAQSPPRSVS